MKYFPLVWTTLWRKKTRTLFTLLSVIVAFLLFGVLETVDYAFSHADGGITGADKLVTTNKYSITLQLPFSDVQQIRSVPGVAWEPGGRSPPPARARDRASCRSIRPRC